jgi:hypothetical protein
LAGEFPAVQMALDYGFSGDPGCGSPEQSFACLELSEILSLER